MDIFYQFVRYLRRMLWTIIVAFMLGLHNVYMQEDKMPDDIVFTIEENVEQENSAELHLHRPLKNPIAPASE